MHKPQGVNKMDDYILLFRIDIITKEVQPTPEQMNEYMKQWDDWVSDIEAQNKLVGGNHLSSEGKIVKSSDVVTDGPYVETKKSIVGYIIINAKDFDDAVQIAKKCPILHGEGNSVEVRKVESR